ncbi:MAG: Ldh family oxidoreductase [Candidatus Lokiarchaeota archaeon]|nr:Ldh family oxidoreductase [Candidatus Lokiarchaeota archaeon]
MSEDSTIVQLDTMRRLMEDIFVKLGVPKEDAKICADVLITSDRRGIDSHGCARLYMYYIRIKRGQQLPKTNLTIEQEMPSTARLSANNGMGQVAATKAMQMAIDKAKKTGIGMVTVGQSNHFGIAGYYALMAANQDMIGICGTNARPAIAPTWSVEPKLGTNPLTIGVPTDWEFPWIADHATSIVQRGKIEIYAREGRDVVPGWVIDENGNAATDANQILQDLLDKKAALTPLGGIGEDTGGHKGYNYATLVEILSATLSKANFLSATIGLDKDGNSIPYNLGHFFIAINISAFINLKEFKKTIGQLLRELSSSKLAPDSDYVYVAGEKEHIAERKRGRNGFPISKETQKQIKIMANDLNLNLVKYNMDLKSIEIGDEVDTGW